MKCAFKKASDAGVVPVLFLSQAIFPSAQPGVNAVLVNEQLVGATGGDYLALVPSLEARSGTRAG